MKNKNNIIYGVIALAVFLVVAGFGTQVCLGFSKTYTEDATCQYLRDKEKISSDYICTLGQEYTEKGKTFMNVSFNQPSNYFNQKNYVIDVLSKGISVSNPTV